MKKKVIFIFFIFFTCIDCYARSIPDGLLNKPYQQANALQKRSVLLHTAMTTEIAPQHSLEYYQAVLVGSLMLLAAYLGFSNFCNRKLVARQQSLLQLQRISELEKDEKLLTIEPVLMAQEDERARLAKDLQDGLGGMLSGLKFSLMTLNSSLKLKGENVIAFERSLDILDASIHELRRVAHNVMPEALVKFGLDEALKDYCNSINSTRMLKVKYQSYGIDERIENTTETTIYRIVQELLQNVFQHAKAREALVQLIREKERISIAVEDNGKGFDTNLLEINNSCGWRNIRSRVNYLKGKLDLITGNNGTSVNIELYV